MSDFIRYKTSSPSGDLISFLAGIKQMWLDTGKKGVIYQRLNMIGGSYEGANQPYEDELKNPVCFNQYAFDMMRPLLLSQDYIEDFIVFNGQQFDFDFDDIRQKIFTNQPKGQINRWFFHAFPQMTTDLSKVWVHITKGISNPYKEKIIINYTLRNRNTFINYFFLKEHQDRLIFAGLQNERDVFCKEWDLDVPLLQVDNFYELAKAFNGCKFFMGNQSFCMQLCEALKVPRILECFPFMPTHIVVGDKALDFYHQNQVEYYFEKLLNEKENS